MLGELQGVRAKARVSSLLRVMGHLGVSEPASSSTLLNLAISQGLQEVIEIAVSHKLLIHNASCE